EVVMHSSTLPPLPAGGAMKERATMGDATNIRISRRHLLRTAGLTTGAAAVGLTTREVALAEVQSQPPRETGFINGHVEANGRTMNYVIYVPRDYVPEQSWPVIL